MLAEHQLVERIEARFARNDFLRGGHGSCREDSTTCRTMSQRDFFVLTEEVHRVRAGDRAATQGMYADFYRGALAAHAFASIYRVEFAGGIHGVEQKLRRSARRILNDVS